MARNSDGGTYAIGTDLASAAVVPLLSARKAGAYVSALTVGLTSVAVYGQAITGGAYTLCATYAGTAPYGFSPVEVFACQNFKLVGNQAGSAEVGLSD